MSTNDTPQAGSSPSRSANSTPAGSAANNSFPPLENVVSEAETAAAAVINRGRQDLQISLMEAMGPPGDELLKEMTPEVQAMVEGHINSFIDQAMAELPTMIDAAIDEVLGDDAAEFLSMLANNEYTCSRPCNCEPGCPGPVLNGGNGGMGGMCPMRC